MLCVIFAGIFLRSKVITTSGLAVFSTFLPGGLHGARKESKGDRAAKGWQNSLFRPPHTPLLPLLNSYFVRTNTYNYEPQGWLSWNTYGRDVDSEIKEFLAVINIDNSPVVCVCVCACVVLTSSFPWPSKPCHSPKSSLQECCSPSILLRISELGSLPIFICVFVRIWTLFWKLWIFSRCSTSICSHCSPLAVHPLGAVRLCTALRCKALCSRMSEDPSPSRYMCQDGPKLIDGG